VPIAAWMLFVEQRALAGIEIVDPLAARLAEIGQSGDPVRGLLSLRQVFPERLATDTVFTEAVARAAERMRSGGPRALLTEELADA
jgi:fructuronate reductase